jgi:hypothetical protein
VPLLRLDSFWTVYKNTVRTSQRTQYVSATEPSRLMLFGETVAVYCENHTEHTDTVRTSQQTYGTHRYSPYLTGTIRNTQTRSAEFRAYRLMCCIWIVDFL